jgi:hypothetical protein
MLSLPKHLYQAVRLVIQRCGRDASAAQHDVLLLTYKSLLTCRAALLGYFDFFGYFHHGGDVDVLFVRLQVAQ